MTGREHHLPRGSPRITLHQRKNLVGERVRLRRKALRLTLRALGGRIADVSAGFTDEQWNPFDHEIAKIEKGQRICSDLELLCLANALECDPCWLLMGEDSGSASQPKP